MADPPAAELKRSMTQVPATAMVVGTIIGASIFVQPSEITALVPSIGGAAAIWLVAGILTFFGALVCAELASAFSRTGGVYVFLNETYSPAMGFLWGWAMFWSMHSGILAAIAVVFARYVAFFVPLGPTGVQFVAAGAILVLSAINYRGIEHGSRLQTAFTIGKVAAIVLMIAAGLVLAPAGPAGAAPLAAPPAAATAAVSWNAIVQALIAGLFAFGGWHMVTYAAGETVDPTRTIPRALLGGTVVVTLCYIALNAVYMYVLPLDVVISSSRVAADAADALVGGGGGGLMSGLVIFSTFGALNGIVLAGPRVYYSMAQDGLLFNWAGRAHPTFRTPHLAIVLQGVWASVLVFTGTYSQLFSRVIYVEWIFFGLMALGLFILRRRPDYRPTYRVPGAGVVAGAFALASFVIMLNRFITEPLEAILGLGIVLLGVPVYYFWLARPKGA
jgi:APA family basic amino acid/polyamine antiporter